MPEYRPIRYREVIAKLHRLGFTALRQSGSHITFFKAGLPRPFTVADHPSQTAKPGTLNSIFKSAGLTHEEFYDA